MISYIYSIDLWIEQTISVWRGGFLGKLFYLITQLGSPVAIILVAAFVAVYLWRNNRMLLRYFICFAAINEAVIYLLKMFVDRQRPIGAILYGESSGSLPSGHAAAAIFFYGYIYYLVSVFGQNLRHTKLIKFLLGLIIILISLSRLYLGVHFFSDVVVGLGIGGVFLSGLIFNSRVALTKK